MNKKLNLKFPFVFNQIDFREENQLISNLNKKKKVIDMLEKQDFINQNFTIADFEGSKDEINNKIESLLPKYEEYRRDCLQREHKLFSNFRKYKFHKKNYKVTKQIPFSHSTTRYNSPLKRKDVIDTEEKKCILNIKDLSKNLRKTMNDIISEKIEFESNTISSPTKAKKENSLPIVKKNKNTSVIESLYGKSAYFNFFKNYIPTYSDENVNKVIEEKGKSIYIHKPSKEFENLNHTDDIYKKTQSSFRSTNLGTTFMNSNRSNKQNNFNISNFLPKKLQSPNQTLLKHNLNKSFSDQMLCKSPEKLCKLDGSLKCRKTTSYLSVRSSDTRKTHRKVLLTECDNIIGNSEKVLTENKVLIEQNQSKTKRIYDTHLSKRKYMNNDVDLKMFKNETKLGMKKIDVFLYGNSRGHKLDNEHKIFFFQTDREQKRVLFKKN